MWRFLFAWSTAWNIGFSLGFFSCRKLGFFSGRKLCSSIQPPIHVNDALVDNFNISKFDESHHILIAQSFKVASIVNCDLFHPTMCALIINNINMHLIFSPNDLNDFPMIPQWKSSLMFQKKTDNQWYWEIGKYFTQQSFPFISCSNNPQVIEILKWLKIEEEKNVFEEKLLYDKLL